jgi:putative ATP-dependent endonuclease of the OLD family
VLADGDAPEQFSPNDEAALTALGVSVQVWSDQLCLEERAMLDLPWDCVLKSAKLAHEELHFPVPANVGSVLKTAVTLDIESWVDSPELRAAIGKAARASSWFKDVTRGDQWFKAIAPAFADPKFLKTDLARKLDSLWSWVENA